MRFRLLSQKGQESAVPRSVRTEDTPKSSAICASFQAETPQKSNLARGWNVAELNHQTGTLQKSKSLESFGVKKTTQSSSPTSVRDPESMPTLSRRTSYQSEDESASSTISREDADVFRALDRALRYVSSDEEDEDDKDDVRTGSLASVFNRQLFVTAPNDISKPPPASAADADIRLFSLSLFLHADDNKNARSIVEKSLKRHFSIHFGESVAQDKTEEWARSLILEGKFKEAAAAFTELDPPRTAPIFLAILNILLDKERLALTSAKQSLFESREEDEKMEMAMKLVVLGLVAFRFGKDARALQTWREALQISISVFGYDHRYVGTILNNIGCLHYLNGDISTSLQLFSEAVTVCRVSLSAAYNASIIRDISLAQMNIAMVMAHGGHYEAALGQMEEALLLQESIEFEIGSTKLIKDTACSIEEVANYLAAVSSASAGASSGIFHSGLAHSGLPADAEEKCNAKGLGSCDTQQTVFGTVDGIPMRGSGSKSLADTIDPSEHMDVLNLGPLGVEHTPKVRVRTAVLLWLGKSLHDDGPTSQLPSVTNPETARKRPRIPIDLDSNRAIDAEHHLDQIVEQAVDHLKHDEPEEALELFQSALKSHRQKYGDSHHLVGSAIHNIGIIYVYAQKYSRALQAFQEALKIRQDALGLNHPLVAASLMKIGMIYLLRRDPVAALDAFVLALEITEASVGYSTLQTARLLNNIGVAHYEAGSDEAAHRSLLDALAIQQSIYHSLTSLPGGPVREGQNRTVILGMVNIQSNIAFLDSKAGRLTSALRILQAAKESWREQEGVFAWDLYYLEENTRFVENRIDSRVTEKTENESEIESMWDRIIGSTIMCSNS